MKKYITTYFYHDCEDMGASYGNIFLPLVKRNMIYWQTVYTLFFSSIVCNKNSDVSYVLFTNVATFPFRNEIEALGVKIYDDLKLTSRNPSKWATVKFFFDVIDYIGHHQDFDDDDAFVMLDTDVVALSSAEPLFNYLQNQENAIAYVFDNAKNKDFHGVNLSNLEEIGSSAYGMLAKIEGLIGGEFFCFRKNQISAIAKLFKVLNDSNHSNILSTEEQILTLVHAQKPWAIFPQAIYRVWTTLRVFKIPKNNKKYIFLHLPSEKEVGLNKLFNITKNRKPLNMTEIDFRQLFYRCIPLHQPFSLYFSKLMNKVICYFRQHC
jgi:hypothetical protein